ncbi:hypothetical protein [Massilia sp. BJB1822]|uniref:hypothetical protein n=1 Tax=Massilia sp. BJB1822 TaxID=2744470 RepID=UPI0015936195|nr:hypothetical protein [Massilia sp. BJB1822]NVE00171.1 hypothetical protein [Massilia sp. BJB1822]
MQRSPSSNSVSDLAQATPTSGGSPEPSKANIGKSHDDQLRAKPAALSEQQRSLLREALDLDTRRDLVGKKPAQSRERSLKEMAAMDKGSGSALRAQPAVDNNPKPLLRPRPLLANHTDLIQDAAQALAKRGVLPADNLIKTAYSGREVPRERKIADNLILDANLHFEAHLQREIEHNTHFLDCVKDATKLIHQQLNIESLRDIDLDNIEQDIREVRLETVKEMLKDFYQDETLQPLLKEGKWDDKTFKGVAFKFREDIPGTPGEVADKKDVAVGLLKLYKMLETQKPYFGGSVEYMDKRKESLEHWVYHLSSLTKDPARQYPPSDLEHNHLSKRLMDYRTGADSLLPKMNQRNLGTGVVEAKWAELPAELQNDIQAGMRKFGDAVGSRGDMSGDKRFAGVAKLHKDVAQRIAKESPELAADPNLEFKLTMEQVWEYANEDERKFIYGDVTQIPWSDAHLHGGEAFEQTYVPKENLEQLGPKHPDTEGPGLWNVAGVKGNILQTAAEAGRKYREEMTRLDKQTETIGERAAEFIDKHGDWYDQAMENHKPIIGGMSGHTLGYLNLYQAARDDFASKNEGVPIPGPSTEELRAVMLAGLIGEKRHHSYDEVLAASHEMGDKGQTVKYDDRAGYHDVLESENPEIRKCAGEALEKAKADYSKIARETVLNTVLDHIDHLHRERGLFRNSDPTGNTLTDDEKAANKIMNEEVQALRKNITLKMDAYLDSLDKGEGVRREAKAAVQRAIADIYAPVP